jgi:site-specific recombinase XerD
VGIRGEVVQRNTAFFVEDDGQRLRYQTLRSSLQRLLLQLGLAERDACSRPTPHSLRHSFAVTRLTRWHEKGLDVRTRLAHLAPYLGHGDVRDTYWYLIATPELLRGQVTFGSNTYVQPHGKGRKERTVPLWPQTARILQGWFHELESMTDSLAFPTIRRSVMSADGLNHLLQQAVQRASTDCPSLLTKRVTPHVIRHATALHLLQSVSVPPPSPWAAKDSWYAFRTGTIKPPRSSPASA